MKKKRIGKLSRITAVLIAALLTVTGLTVGVFAADGSPTVYEAGDAEQFIEAVEQARDGDTIRITAWIRLQGVFHFSDDKHLTIVRDNRNAFLGFNDLNPGGDETVIKNMTFDGQGIATGDSFVSITSGYYTFEGCTFQNCGKGDNAGGQNPSGAALLNYAATVTLKGCTFKDNYASSGGHIYAYENGVTTLDGCALTNGHAYDQGGGVCNIGRMTVKNTLIFGNTAANGGNDIRNLRTVDLKDSIETLTALVNDPTKIVEGWKDEGTGTFFAVPSECSMEYLTLVISDKQQEDPSDDPGNDDNGDDNGNQDEGGDKDSVSDNDAGDQSGDSGSGGSTGGGSTSTETNTTTTTTTTDNSTTTTTTTTTTDNSDRSTVTDRHDSVNNSTVNNYYQAAAGEAKAEQSTAAPATGQTTTQAAQPVQGQAVDTSRTDTPTSAYNGQGGAENAAAVNSLDKDTDAPEAPHFDIDLTGVDCAIRTNDAGSYDIVIRNAPPAENATPDMITLTAYEDEAESEPERAAAPDVQQVETVTRKASALDVTQTALLAAVLICLVLDFRTRRRGNIHAEQ